MTQGEVNIILKKGSKSKKIMLFMEDAALSNTTGSNALEYSKRRMITKNNLLTQKERKDIWESIEDEKDIELLNVVTSTNKSFAIMKPYIESFFLEIIHLSNHFIREIENETKKTVLSKSINDILNIVPEKEKILDIAIKNNTLKSKLINSTIIENQNKLFAINKETDEKILKDLIKIINTKKENLKYLIEVTRKVLLKYLPLSSYFEYLEDMEGLIKDTENNIFQVLKDMNNISKTLSLSLSRKGKVIKKYGDMVIVVTDEDIKDFRSKA